MAQRVRRARSGACGSPTRDARRGSRSRAPERRSGRRAPAAARARRRWRPSAPRRARGPRPSGRGRRSESKARRRGRPHRAGAPRQARGRRRARGEAEAAGGIVDRPEARELEAQLVAQETDEPPRDCVGLVLADQGVADDTEERQLLETVDERAARLAQRPLESLLLHQCCAIASQARRRSASNDAITRSRSRGPRPRRSHAAGAIAGMRPSPPKP